MVDHQVFHQRESCWVSPICGQDHNYIFYLVNFNTSSQNGKRWQKLSELTSHPVGWFTLELPRKVSRFPLSSVAYAITAGNVLRGRESHTRQSGPPFGDGVHRFSYTIIHHSSLVGECHGKSETVHGFCSIKFHSSIASDRKSAMVQIPDGCVDHHRLCLKME